MKRLWQVVVVVVCVMLIGGCGNNQRTIDNTLTEKQTTKQSETNLIETETNMSHNVNEKVFNAGSVADVINGLENGGIPIIYSVIYTSENDPNGKGEKDYLEKGNFADSRIEENYSEEEPLSGSIEIFESDEKAIERRDYLESLSSLDSFPNKIVRGNVLLRLSGEYSDDQIQEFFSLLNSDRIIDQSKPNKVVEQRQKDLPDKSGLENAVNEALEIANIDDEFALTVADETNIDEMSGTYTGDIIFKTDKGIVLNISCYLGDEWSVISIKNSQNKHYYYSYGNTSDTIDIYDYNTDKIKQEATKTAEQVLSEGEDELESAQKKAEEILNKALEDANKY